MSRSMLLSSVTALAFCAISQPGFAQDTIGTTATTEDDSQCVDVDRDGVCDTDEAVDEATGSIIVTGSRIARPNLDASNPVTSITVEQLTDTGDVNIGDNLNDLPSLRSTFSQGNSTRFIGTAGLNLLDLRGLGTSRTLVLVNGRRHVTSSVGDYLVDVNTIPVDLLERVDIVTGGTSAVYGSDAIAGVVNFILRRDYDGIVGRAQAGISDEGDRATQSVSLTAGKNFADGRGNVTLSGSYTNSEPLYFSQRDSLTGAFSGRRQFNLAEPVAGEPAAGDGIFDNLFFNGNVRNGTISDGGLITAGCLATQIADPRRCLPGSTAAARFGQRYVFQPDGSLVLNDALLDFRLPTLGGSSNTLGGKGSTLRNTGQLFPQNERYTANLLAHFELSDAFVPFVEAKYVRVNSFQEGQPSFFQGSLKNFFANNAAQFNSINELRCNNPFLTAQALGTLQSIGQCTTPATGTFTISRFNVDFGGRRQDVKRETYRVVGGIEGRFNDDWRYEVSANYGRFDERVDFQNNLLLFDLNGRKTGFLNAVDAVRNGQGQIVCAVNNDADPTNDDPACIPINVFGQQNFTQAQLDYIQTTGFSNGRAEQLDFLAFVSGDMSQLFELPGGPISFSVGAEYRTEKARQAYDPLTASGGTFLNAIQPFSPPKQTVKEAFGEIRIPILSDLPFANELTLEAAGRVSDYNTASGTVYAYNVGGIYSPFDGLRIRGNYSKSVRVPTQGDLFSPQSQNFAFIADPCDVLFINNGPNRAANCAAFGVPAGFVNQPARDRSTGFASGGNPTLTEETGKSFTAGAVLEPAILPGFSITADYYNIKVTNLIATLGAQTIINQCFDSTTGINNPFCATVNRDANGFFVDPAVISGGVNFARQDAQGVDVEMVYNHKFDNGQSVRASFISTYVIERTNFVNPIDPGFGQRQLSSLGDPKFSANAGITYDFGDFQLGYSTRYIGDTFIGGFETYNSFQGRPPTNADLTQEQTYGDLFYHNIRGQVDVTSDFNVFAGIDNFTDKKPPFGLLGTGGGDPYDTVGRYFFFGVRSKFR